MFSREIKQIYTRPVKQLYGFNKPQKVIKDFPVLFQEDNQSIAHAIHVQ
jgi:hypothetical protein